MGFTDELLSQFMGVGAQELTRKTGARQNQIEDLLSMALPALMQGMQRNASTAGGAESLARALDDHADDPDDVAELLRGANTDDGAKIISHILGGQAESVTNGLSRKTGMSGSQVAQALAASAPALLSLLGTQKRRGSYNSGGIAGMLGSLMGGSGGGLESIISMAMADRDGDGNSDLLESLGGLFGKR